MKIITFDPKELNSFEIQKIESKKAAIIAFLLSIAKYHLILAGRILNSWKNNLVDFSTLIFNTRFDVSIIQEISNQKLPLFCLKIQNPNFKF